MSIITFKSNFLFLKVPKKKKKRVCLSRMEPQSGPLKMLGVTAAGEAAGLGTERRHDKDTPCREPESENQPKTKPKGRRGCI